MHIIGIDLARPGSEQTVLTTRNRHWLSKGDRVPLSGAPNSVRHHVVRVISMTAVEIAASRRPSKGMRKHIRRAKAAQR